MYRESCFLQPRKGREKAPWSTTVTTLILWTPLKRHCTIGTSRTITHKCQDTGMCMDTSYIFKKQVDTKIWCASTKKIGVIITDHFFSCFVSTWYACISSFFTSGFAGTLAIRPWFRIHDIQSHRWKHEHNIGGISNQMAMQGESFVPMFGEIRMVSVWCVMAFPFFSVLWQNYLVAWTASPGKGQSMWRYSEKCQPGKP